MNFVHKYLKKHISDEKATHRSYGECKGNFVLNKDQTKEMMKLYVDAIDKGETNLTILEMPKEYGPIVIDIDLEQLEDTRLYDGALIKTVIKYYIESINKYLKVSKKCYNIYLLEKEKPTYKEKETKYKDGFHVMFPDICVQQDIRHLIRCYAVKLYKKNNTFDGFLNDPVSIIDKAVVSTNGWLLYGSKKPDGYLYSLTKMFNGKVKTIYKHNPNDDESYNNEVIIYNLSLHKSEYSKKNATPFNDNYDKSDIKEELIKYGIIANPKKPTISSCKAPDYKNDDVNDAIKLVNMLSDDKADNHNDWINVGLALHNIDNSLLSTWIEFSKNSSKFKDGECEKMWKNIKTPTNGKALTINSLAFWAKKDNPEEYAKYKNEKSDKTMSASLDNGNYGTTYSIGKILYSMYSDRFVCSSIKTNFWWEFKNHRWNRCEQAYTLNRLISEELPAKYLKKINEMNDATKEYNKEANKKNEEKAAQIYKLVARLQNSVYKKQVIDECKNIFFDPKFDEKLDCNINLIGFENGVYDLQKEEFREGKPDDYITLSTKNDYIEWSNVDKAIKRDITGFFEQVFPIEPVRNYFINVLSSCLSGSTQDEKLYIMNGSGSNGKSLTNDLMFLALGDYYMSCPISMMTRKRGQSNETAPEKVRMKGRRCGIFQETDDGDKLNVGVMKEFTGGDKVLVRDLFKGSNEMIEFKPQMKYFFTCNQLPEVPSIDDGTWRRLRVISFVSKFTDKPDKTKPYQFPIDNKLKNKIEKWAPAFVSYLIHIYNTSYKKMDTLQDPDEVMTSTNHFKMGNDYYTEFISDRINRDVDEKETVETDHIWRSFKKWYNNSYPNKALPKRTEFTKNINKMLGEPVNKEYKKCKIIQIKINQEIEFIQENKDTKDKKYSNKDNKHTSNQDNGLDDGIHSE